MRINAYDSCGNVFLNLFYTIWTLRLTVHNSLYICWDFEFLTSQTHFLWAPKLFQSKQTTEHDQNDTRMRWNVLFRFRMSLLYFRMRPNWCRGVACWAAQNMFLRINVCVMFTKTACTIVANANANFNNCFAVYNLRNLLIKLMRINDNIFVK